jgi:hypothetical protein
LHAYASTVLATGAGGPAIAYGAGPNIRLDNVAPDYTAVAWPAAVVNREHFIGEGFTFTHTGTNAIFTGLADVTPGVGGVSVTYHAALTADLAGLGTTAPAQNAAVVAQYPARTTVAGLESTFSNTAYTLVARVTDALGNTRIARVGTFGVDVVAPTIAFVAGSTAADATNPAVTVYNVLSTDVHSGPEFIHARILGYSVLEVNNDAATEVRCYNNAGGIIHTAPTAAQLAGTCWFTIGVTGTADGAATINLPGDENFYVTEIRAEDRAGNVSTVITRQALIDETEPDAIITSTTIAGSAVSITGRIEENIDLAGWDVRFQFPGVATTAFTLPNLIPFVPMTTVSSYGLPLTGVVIGATGSNDVAIRRLNIGTVAAPNLISPDAIGFGAVDVARNFGFGGQGYTAPTGDGVLGNLADFTLARAHATIRVTSPTTASPSSTTLTATVSVPAPDQDLGHTGLNPVQRVYFYRVVRHGAAFDDAVDYLLLMATATAHTSVQTGPTIRTFTYTQTVAASAIQVGDNRFVAIAVDADGDAILSNGVVIERVN